MCRHVRVVTTLMNDIQNVTYPRPRRPAQNKQLHLLQIKHLASASVCYCKLPHCYVCENDGPSLPGLLVHLNLYSVIIIRLAAALVSSVLQLADLSHVSKARGPSFGLSSHLGHLCLAVSRPCLPVRQRTA